MPNSPHGNGLSKSVADMHPIAKVSVGQILGLVEAIDESGDPRTSRRSLRRSRWTSTAWDPLSMQQSSWVS